MAGEGSVMMTPRMPAADIGRGKWATMLPQLGVDRSFLSGKHGPCPMCGGKDRWRFDDKEGRGTWFCTNCGSGDGFHLVMLINDWEFREARQRVEDLASGVTRAPTPPPMTEEARRQSLRDLWVQSRVTVRGDVVDQYLTGRGVGLRDYPFDLRTIHEARAERKEVAVMLALVRAPTGEGATLHRTFLRPDGSGKADVSTPRKLMPGEVTKGSAIRLSPAPVGGVLGVAEGIETALAARKLFGVPVWSAMNARMLEQFVWPTELKTLRVFADRDPKFGGQAAAYALAHRAACAGLTVTVEMPETDGDWLDVLASQGDEKAWLRSQGMVDLEGL